MSVSSLSQIPAYLNIDRGQLSLLGRRAIINTEDDQFDTTSLDAKWLAYTGANPTTDLTVLSGWCKLTSSGYKLQAVPAGDWTIECEILLADTTTAIYQNEGLILTNGTTQSSATDARYGIGHNNNLKGFRLEFEKFVNGSFSATYDDFSQSGTGGGGGTPAILDHMFLRINKTSTTYVVEFSVNGKTWQRQASTSSLGFTPTHFGFGGNASSGNYFNYFLRY